MNIFLPEGIRRRIGAEQPEQTGMGCSGAQVFRAGDMYLKIAPAGELSRAAAMQEYFAKKGLSAPLVAYEQADAHDFLLVKAVQGECACCAKLLETPARLAKMLGETARMLHETPAADCPLDNVNERALEMYARENGREYPGGAALLQKDALVHADHCLPNVFYADGRFSGYIDLGDAGIGDRHLDLCCAVWSLGYNTKSRAWGAVFLDAYGRDRIDEERLQTCQQLYGYAQRPF